MSQSKFGRQFSIDFGMISFLFHSRNALWTPKSSLQADFVKRMMENGFSSTECHLGIDIHAFIESKKELGATSLELTDKYEDKDFLLKILNILIELKMVLKTGVCQLTFVHRSYVKPWIVLTYHLKRLERVSLNKCFLISFN